MSYDIERYLNVRQAYGPSFGPDGQLAFLLDVTGVSQVWRLDAPLAWPEQLTFYEEPVGFVTWSPERPELAFGMDEDGNERTQIYRLAGDGSEVVDLTREPEAIHNWGGWSHDGERFAFSSNRRDESVFDVYVQDRDAVGDEARLLAETDGWFNVNGWSPGDDRLVVVELRSNLDQNVHVLDVETGDLRQLTDDDEPVRYGGVRWGPEGESLYVATDRDSDTLYLARIDAETGELSVVDDCGEWNVDGLAIDHDSGRMLYSVNVEGYNEVHVGEIDGDEFHPFPEPDLPAGIVGGGSFDPNGDRIAFSVTGPTENDNVHVVDVETGASERWTNAATAGIPRESFVSPELVHFESFDGLEIPAFFSTPADGDGPFPVVVDIHGGPESQRRPLFRGLTQYLLGNGYAVLEPNVRGSTGYGKEYSHLDDVEKRMDSVADLEAGVRWLREREDVDPDRIAAYGGSYGGFMVLAALTEYPDLWAGGVDVVGIANFVTFLENTGDWRRSQREVEYGSLEEDRELLERISPINDVEAIDAPLFVLHGENDPRVPVGEARQVAEEASEHVPVETLVFDDEGHGFGKLENRITAYRRVVEFLDEYVRD